MNRFNTIFDCEGPSPFLKIFTDLHFAYKCLLEIINSSLVYNGTAYVKVLYYTKITVFYSQSLLKVS